MRLRNGTVATVIIFLTSFLSLSWYTAWQNGKEKLIAYQREFHALKERLRVAEHRTLQRSSELNNILEQFRHAIAETNNSKDALTNFSDETQKLLKELANRKPLQVPDIYHHLPHLLNNEGSLHPAVQVGLGRTGVTEGRNRGRRQNGGKEGGLKSRTVRSSQSSWRVECSSL